MQLCPLGEGEGDSVALNFLVSCWYSLGGSLLICTVVLVSWSNQGSQRLSANMHSSWERLLEGPGTGRKAAACTLPRWGRSPQEEDIFLGFHIASRIVKPVSI